MWRGTKSKAVIRRPVSGRRKGKSRLVPSNQPTHEPANSCRFKEQTRGSAGLLGCWVRLLGGAEHGACARIGRRPLSQAAQDGGTGNRLWCSVNDVVV